jgi:hypothetical protein
MRNFSTSEPFLTFFQEPPPHSSHTNVGAGSGSLHSV